MFNLVEVSLLQFACTVCPSVIYRNRPIMLFVETRLVIIIVYKIKIDFSIFYIPLLRFSSPTVFTQGNITIGTLARMNLEFACSNASTIGTIMKCLTLFMLGLIFNILFILILLILTVMMLLMIRESFVSSIHSFRCCSCNFFSLYIVSDNGTQLVIYCCKINSNFETILGPFKLDRDRHLIETN